MDRYPQLGELLLRLAKCWSDRAQEQGIRRPFELGDRVPDQPIRLASGRCQQRDPVDREAPTRGCEAGEPAGDAGRRVGKDSGLLSRGLRRRELRQ